MHPQIRGSILDSIYSIFWYLVSSLVLFKTLVRIINGQHLMQIINKNPILQILQNIIEIKKGINLLMMNKLLDILSKEDILKIKKKLKMKMKILNQVSRKTHKFLNKMWIKKENLKKLLTVLQYNNPMFSLSNIAPVDLIAALLKGLNKLFQSNIQI